MTCKCGEIAALARTLGALNEARNYLNNYNSNLFTFETEVDALGNNVDLTLYADHADEIKTNLCKKTELFRPPSTSLGEKVSAKITELSGTMRTLQEEDTAYHEEERKRIQNINNTTGVSS